MAGNNTRQYNVYKKHFEEKGHKVIRDSNDPSYMIVNDEYRVSLPTGWTTNLKTGEKSRNPYHLFK